MSLKRKRLSIEGGQCITKFFKPDNEEETKQKVVANDRACPLTPSASSSDKSAAGQVNRSDNIFEAFKKIESTALCTSDLFSESQPAENREDSSDDIEFIGFSFVGKMDGTRQESFEEALARQAELNEKRYNRKTRKHACRDTKKTETLNKNISSPADKQTVPATKIRSPESKSRSEYFSGSSSGSSDHKKSEHEHVQVLENDKMDCLSASSSTDSSQASDKYKDNSVESVSECSPAGKKGDISSFFSAQNKGKEMKNKHAVLSSGDSKEKISETITGENRRRHHSHSDSLLNRGADKRDQNEKHQSDVKSAHGAPRRHSHADPDHKHGCEQRHSSSSQKSEGSSHHYHRHHSHHHHHSGSHGNRPGSGHHHIGHETPQQLTSTQHKQKDSKDSCSQGKATHRRDSGDGAKSKTQKTHSSYRHRHVSAGGDGTQRQEISEKQNSHSSTPERMAANVLRHSSPDKMKSHRHGTPVSSHGHHSHHKSKPRRHSELTSGDKYKKHSDSESPKLLKKDSTSRNLFSSTSGAIGWPGVLDRRRSSDQESATCSDSDQQKLRAGLDKLRQLYKKQNIKASTGERASDCSTPNSEILSVDIHMDNCRVENEGLHGDEKTSKVAWEGSKDVLDDSDDDDDDEELVPGMLASISHHHSRTTGSSPISSSQNASQVSVDNSLLSDSASYSKSFKPSYSLDSLLSEKIQQDARDKELADIDLKLMEGIEQGGIRKLVSTMQQEEEILPEHKEELDKLQIKDSEISDQHPGKLTFNPLKYKCLFTENVSLASFGFVPGNNYMDNHLATLPPELLHDLLTTDVVHMCMQTVACPSALLSWLFHLMSVHPISRISDGAFRIIYRTLHKQAHGAGANWVPSPQDIARVFLNYGADKQSLFADTDILNVSHEQLGLTGSQGAPVNGNDCYDYSCLQLVIQTVCYAVQLRSHLYRDEDLVAITTMLCSVALDEQLNDDILKYDFIVCMSGLLNAFSEDHWEDKAAELCQVLTRLTSHHHNMAYLVSLMPPVPRGLYLQRRLAIVMLRQLLLDNAKPMDLRHISLEDLICIVGELRTTTHTDYYFLSSVILLIDQAVGNETLQPAEKVNLKRLTDMLRGIMGNVRDHPSMLDRTKVKDMMVRITAKWTFMGQSMTSKQKSIFAYTKSKSPQTVSIEKVECSQEDNEDDTENPSLDAEHSEVSENANLDAELFEMDENTNTDAEHFEVDENTYPDAEHFEVNENSKPDAEHLGDRENTNSDAAYSEINDNINPKAVQAEVDENTNPNARLMEDSENTTPDVTQSKTTENPNLEHLEVIENECKNQERFEADVGENDSQNLPEIQ